MILAIAAGVLVAGHRRRAGRRTDRRGLNAVVQHLAANTSPGDDPVEELAEDYEETGATVDVGEEAAR